MLAKYCKPQFWMLVVLCGLAMPARALAAKSDPEQGYADLLKRYVKDGRVDYKAIKKHGMPKLNAFLKFVGDTRWPNDRNARLGLGFDAYNALVIGSVIRYGRPRSVLDVKGFFKKSEHRVAGKMMSLDHLEKSVINPFAKDPRTHFVLVCAAVGCPKLESKPYGGSQVTQRMERAAQRYLDSPWGAAVRPNQVKLSKIFDWYKKDFGGPKGVRDFVLRHLSKRKAEQAGKDPKIEFLDYNWTLNQQ